MQDACSTVALAPVHSLGLSWALSLPLSGVRLPYPKSQNLPGDDGMSIVHATFGPLATHPSSAPHKHMHTRSFTAPYDAPGSGPHNWQKKAHLDGQVDQ